MSVNKRSSRAVRNLPVIFPFSLSVNQVWNNMPVAATEFINTAAHRFVADLTEYTEARLVVNRNVAGFANAILYPMYSIDNVNFYSLGANNTPSVPLSATGVYPSSWVPIVSGARRDVYLTVVGQDGNGIADPNFGSIYIEVR